MREYFPPSQKHLTTVLHSLQMNKLNQNSAQIPKKNYIQTICLGIKILGCRYLTGNHCVFHRKDTLFIKLSPCTNTETFLKTDCGILLCS